MIVGIGLDLVDVKRIRRAMANPRFVARILTPDERVHCRTAESVAGRWAAKEAIAKAIGLELTWQQVEIVGGPNGVPVANMLSPTFKMAEHRIHVSITHERGHAAAVAILEKL